MTERKLVWQGDAKAALRGFPDGVKWVFGRALFKIELGKHPSVASPMKGRLRGIVELAADEEDSTYRLYYTLKCPRRVYVLY